MRMLVIFTTSCCLRKTIIFDHFHTSIYYLCKICIIASQRRREWIKLTHRHKVWILSVNKRQNPWAICCDWTWERASCDERGQQKAEKWIKRNVWQLATHNKWRHLFTIIFYSIKYHKFIIFAHTRVEREQERNFKCTHSWAHLVEAQKYSFFINA